MNPTDTFSIELTSEELLWLTRCLGYTYLPLLQAGPENLPESKMEAVQSSLMERGFVVHHESTGWVIDRLIFALVHIMANPHAVLAIQAWDRTGGQKRMFVYNKVDLPLIVEAVGDWHFTFCSTQTTLVDQVTQSLKLPATCAILANGPHIEDIERVVPLVWGSFQEGALTTFVESGLSENECETIRDFLASMENCVICSELQMKDGDPHLGERHCLFWNEQGLWMGTLQDRAVNLLSISGERVRAFFMMNEPQFQ